MDPIVRDPQIGETFEDYWNSYTPEQKTTIIYDERTSHQFCSTLVNLVNQTERVDGDFQRLTRILGVSFGHERFLHLMDNFEQSRIELLKALDPGELRSIYKWHSVIKIGFCVADIVSVLGHFFHQEYEIEFLKIAEPATRLIAHGSLFNTLIEFKRSANLLFNVSSQVKNDQEHFAPIREWYQQSKDLENAINNVFPFNQTERLLKVFENRWEKDISNGQNAFDPVAFISVLLQEEKADEESSVIYNLISFILHSQFMDICISMIFRRKCKILFEAFRMLESYKDNLSSFLAKIPRWKNLSSLNALIGCDYNYAMTILRLIVDTLSFVDSVDSLRKLDNECLIPQMKDLRTQMVGELATLQRIKDFIISRQQAQQFL